MTKLERDKCVVREVDGGKFGPLVIEAHGEWLYLREKGRRTRFGPLTWSGLYVDAVKRTVDSTRRQRGKAKPRTRRSAKLAVGL